MGGRPAFAGLEQGVDPGLCVYGMPADLWPDDGAPPPLVPWPASDAAAADAPAALVDRFDARLLLDAVPPGVDGHAGRRGRHDVQPADEELTADAALAAEVEAVAWADLASARGAPRPPSPPPQGPGPEIAPPAALAASTDDATEAQAAPEPFVPPPNLPPHLPHPPSAKVAAIIARTAAFVRAAGGRRLATEIALRTTHAGKFEFLEASSPLHPLYQWWVEEGGGGGSGGKEEEGEAEQPSAGPSTFPGTGGGLPVLVAYGSSSSGSIEDGGGRGDGQGEEDSPQPSPPPPPPKRARNDQTG